MHALTDELAKLVRNRLTILKVLVQLL